MADGLSTDGTREIIQELERENPKIHIIDNPEKIVSTGFNRALSIQKGIMWIHWHLGLIRGKCSINWVGMMKNWCGTKMMNLIFA